MVKPILSRIFQGLFFASFVWIYFSVMFTNSGNKPWLSIILGVFMLAGGIGIAYFCKKVVWCCISNQTGRSRSGGPPIPGAVVYLKAFLYVFGLREGYL